MERFRINKKNIFTFGILFVSLIVIYMLALYSTALLPMEKIKANIAKSSQTIEEQRDWEDPVFFNRWGPTSIDYGIDAYTMNIMYNIDSKEPLKSILLDKLHYVDTISSYDVSTFVSMINGNAPKEYHYGRYWNGYISIWRPMFLFFDYTEIRAINVFLFCMIVFLLVMSTARKLGYISAIALALSLVFINFWCIPWSQQYVLVFYIALIGSLIILNFNIKKEISYMKIFFVLGSSTIFLDNTTVPPITFAVPFIFLIVKHKEIIDQQSFKQVLFFLFRMAFLWVMGYGLTLIMKPALAALFDPSHSTGFIEHVVLRTSGKGGEMENFSIITIFNAALARNFYNFFTALYSMESIFIIAVLLFSWLILRKKGRFSPVFYMLLVVSIIPVLWCAVAAYHSVEHHMLNYRIWMISALSLLFAYKDSIDTSKIRKNKFKNFFV